MFHVSRFCMKQLTSEEVGYIQSRRKRKGLNHFKLSNYLVAHKVNSTPFFLLLQMISFEMWQRCTTFAKMKLHLLLKLERWAKPQFLTHLWVERSPGHKLCDVNNPLRTKEKSCKNTTNIIMGLSHVLTTYLCYLLLS